MVRLFFNTEDTEEGKMRFPIFRFDSWEAKDRELNALREEAEARDIYDTSEDSGSEEDGESWCYGATMKIQETQDGY